VRWRIRAKRARYGHSGPITFDLRRAGNGLQAFGVRREHVPKLLARCELAAARKAVKRGGDPFVWGPTYRGWAPEVLAQLGGEDPNFWAPDPEDEYERQRKRCGCARDEFCEDCLPPHVLRRWDAGCGCKGAEVCIECVDPELLEFRDA
jgi:hypothetical protein